jgi:glycosyltransferase involved in cell wall biosynthesis
MRIAFISFELAPDTALGGIATYIGQTARSLAARGHHVEVIAASPSREGTVREDGLVVHRIRTSNSPGFSALAGPVFAARHREVGFDVLEGPEYHADAAEAVRLAPDIPLVVKLHTPNYLMRRISKLERPWHEDVRVAIGAWRRGEEQHESPRHPDTVYERDHAMDADEVVAPSRVIARCVIQDWGLDPSRVVCIPSLFEPSEAFLAVPAEEQEGPVTYAGRLEVRKGVVELAEAAARVMGAVPTARFCFIGRPMESPDPAMRMDEYLKARLSGFLDRVEFEGGVKPEQMPGLLGRSAVCVFPSRWENFPIVGLEAMAAARAIVATAGTGFAEQVGEGEAGVLVPPRSPRALARAIIGLLADPARRRELGAAARRRLLREYSPARICPQMEASYERAIRRRRSLGARPAGKVPAA